jgi:NADPH-dependent 7-cyano-7-deazaguanine reductase QueF
MSQRTQIIEKEITIDLSFKVTLKSFSNHNGFSEKQIENAIEEFKEKIKKQIEYKANGEYYQEEFLNSVDFVHYEVDSEDGL